MKVVKWLAIALVVYVGIVAAFETLIGVLQPESGNTLVITTTGEDGSRSDRVVTALESDGNLYVAANHWPRAWYHEALENPEVEITVDGESEERLAVPVSGAEHERVQSEHRHGILFRILTGFPPRYFLRLDPR